MGNPLEVASVREKITVMESAVHRALLGSEAASVPVVPGRDLEVESDFRRMPPKPGLGSVEGRARLLHDLGSIELQAMELAYRGLIDYPEAPEEFRQELGALALSEAAHLKLCLDGLEELGFRWGHWPVHLGLWQAVHSEDSLLDRILIVHRYLEGSGLDAGTRLLQRLDGLPKRDVCWSAVETIHREEVGHVDFGSQWYRRICRLESLEPDEDFRQRMTRLRAVLPYRTEPLARDVRLRAGFTVGELDFLEEWRRPLNQR